MRDNTVCEQTMCVWQEEGYYRVCTIFVAVWQWVRNSVFRQCLSPATTRGHKRQQAWTIPGDRKQWTQDTSKCGQYWVTGNSGYKTHQSVDSTGWQETDETRHIKVWSALNDRKQWTQDTKVWTTLNDRKQWTQDTSKCAQHWVARDRRHKTHLGMDNTE